MIDDFTYDFLLHVCQEIENKQVETKEKKIDFNTVRDVMCPHLGFYVCPSCGVCSDDICIIGYNESTVMGKKRKCIYKRDKYFQSKIGKFLCRESLKVPDSVIRVIEWAIQLWQHTALLLSGGLTNHTNTRITIEKE